MGASIVRAIRAASDGAARLSWWAAAGFLMLMLSFVGLQVVARYGFAAPPPWTEEAARYAMVWMGLLGATVSYRHHLDPRLVELKTLGPAWLRAVKKIVRAIAALAFTGPILWYGVPFLARQSFRKSESLEFNVALVGAIVPLFAALVLLHVVADLLPDPGKPKEKAVR